MLNEYDYENLKLSLIDSQVLFDKLNSAAKMMGYLYLSSKKMMN